LISTKETATEIVVGFYSTDQVCELTTWSKATLWRQWTKGDFTRPVKTSPGRVGFPREFVDAWYHTKIADAETELEDVIQHSGSTATNMVKKCKRRSAEEIQLERFFDGVSILEGACRLSLEIKIPSLDKEQFQRAVKEVSRAEKSLRKFRTKLENDAAMMAAIETTEGRRDGGK
jgi:predicted DNA-binding transcriptional regulator AlpA